MIDTQHLHVQSNWSRKKYKERFPVWNNYNQLPITNSPIFGCYSVRSLYLLCSPENPNPWNCNGSWLYKCMMIYFIYRIVDPFWITLMFAHFRHSFQNILYLQEPTHPNVFTQFSWLGSIILLKNGCKPCHIWNMNLNSVIQSCKAKRFSRYLKPLIIIWWCEFWELRLIHRPCSFANGMCTDHSILPQGQPVGRMMSLLHGGHVRLGVNFMSWSNFCVLVWLSLPWRDFITLSDIIRICGHVMSDVITLWWSRESWYDFSPSWMKFSSWCDFVCLGVILHLGAINQILVWFSFVLDTIFVLVRFYFFWCR